MHVGRGHLLEVRQVLLQVLEGIAHLQGKQTAQAHAVTYLCPFGFIKQLNRHGIADIDQGRKTDQGLAATPQLHDFRQFAKAPVGVALVFVQCAVRGSSLGGGLASRRGSGCHSSAGLRLFLAHGGFQHRQRLEGTTRLAAQLGLEGPEVTAHAELAAMLIHHAEVHEQVHRHHVELEIGQLHVQPGMLARALQQHIGQTALAKARLLLDLFGQLARTVRQGHKAAARTLRQALEQGLDLVFQHAGDQPLGTLFIDLVQGKQRDFHRDAIACIAGLVQIAGPAIDATESDGARELVGGDAGGFVPHQLILADLQQLRLLATGFAEPLFQLMRVADFTRNLGIVKGVDQLVIHQHVLATRLVLQILDLTHHLAVGCQKRQLALPVVLDQRLADEDVACVFGIELVVIDAAVVVEHDAVQRGTFQRHHLAGLFFPVRVQQLAAQQMRADFFQPLRLYGCHGAAVETAGFHQLGTHHPAARALAQARAGMAEELDAACAQEPVFLVILAANVAQQAGQHALVQLLVTGRLRLRFPALLGRHGQQLAMGVAPFAHAAHVDEVLAQQALVLAIAELVHRLDRC